MARIAVPVTVIDDTGIAVSGASVTVRRRSDNGLATIYSTETGGTTTGNPLATDSHGRVSGWVARDGYKCTITGSGISSYDVNWDAAPARDASIDVPWLSAALVPIGTVIAYAPVDEPSGWLRCNGQAVSRVTYASLYNLIGTTYGEGNGTSTFNVPDLRGRAPVGDDAMGGVQAGRLSSYRQYGQAAGTSTVTLTTTEMPAHTHSVSATNTVKIKTGPGGTASLDAVYGTTSMQSGFAESQVSEASAGDGQAHANLQPYQIVGFLIKAVA